MRGFLFLILGLNQDVGSVSDSTNTVSNDARRCSSIQSSSPQKPSNPEPTNVVEVDHKIDHTRGEGSTERRDRFH